MAGVTRWKPPPSWHAYKVPGGLREYRHGHAGRMWAVIPAARARELMPWWDGGGWPGPYGVIPDGSPEFVAVRLDCTGRLDRMTGSGTREQARRACSDDASSLACGEGRAWEATGRRPAWKPLEPGASADRSPVVLRWARWTWRLRRLADRAVRTRRSRCPDELLRPYMAWRASRG